MPNTALRPDATPTGSRRSVPRTLVAAAAAVGLAVPIGIGVAGSLPDWSSPLAPQTVDRSAAPLLTALRDVAQHRAAEGTFQVLVDLEQDTPWLPSFVSGERTTFFAVGRVDALVDMAGLGEDRVTTSPDRRSVTIALPAPVLAPAVVDPVQSRVVDRDRGIVERLAGVVEDAPTGEQELYALAAGKLDEAARTSDLAARAEENTRTWLTSLAQSLGYEQAQRRRLARRPHHRAALPTSSPCPSSPGRRTWAFTSATRTANPPTSSARCRCPPGRCCSPCAPRCTTTTTPTRPGLACLTWAGPASYGRPTATSPGPRCSTLSFETLGSPAAPRTRHR